MPNPNTFKYQRLVIAYHGYDLATRDKVVSGKEHLKKSEKDYDWLGHGIYFWEHGHDRALRWAKQRKGNSVKSPSVVGALIQLGNCFDLLDTTLLYTILNQKEAKIMSHTTASNHTNPVIKVLADHFAKQTPAQGRQGLIDAGILTKTGNVAAPYKSVIVRKSRDSDKKKVPAST